MLRFLDALLVLSVLINLIKGTELLLRPHQEKWLKSKLESVALWLDYARPIEWYMRNPGGVYLLSQSILFFTGSFLFLQNVNYSDHGTFFIILHSVMLTMVLNIFWVVSQLRPQKEKTRFQIEHDLQEKKLREWLWRSRTIQNSLTRQLVLSLAGLIVLVSIIGCLPLIVFTWVSVHDTSLQPVQLLLITIIFLAIFYRKRILVRVLPLGNIGALATFSLVLTLLIILTEVILKFLRGFVWRVVEYYKGPVAALTLVVTLLLGVTEAYFRFLQK